MGPRAGVDVFGKRKNFLPLPGLDPVRSLVTIPTMQPGSLVIVTVAMGTLIII